MFNRIRQAVFLSLVFLTSLLTQPGLVWQMWAFSRYLPRRFEQPLPEMMAQLTPAPADSSLSETRLRRLADAVAAWHFFSPLGICLRRSLLRYYFLRQAGYPVNIVFGARIKTNAEGGGLGGHAWLTFNGQPYHEHPQDYCDFTPMFIYPVPR